ncbi:hypothetical protein [Rhodococcus erythropolis]|uniref:Resolvase/invertase-type recombinase catalytic domain-containing protein n=1 Tax=Rhodococcus erythropolis TaxID=1833 RepID=A0AAX3ZZ55_RHOER|nr:hypothetical protein [Rhodococcus erythropolis]WMN03159.1 hypothetical protein QIE55_32670 [Rhodococcus erythropolis]WMN03216.1 hypothetical protein QIE55_33070 [Rhodococcus erythropolis]
MRFRLVAPTQLRGTNRTNRDEYDLRWRNTASPLADVCGSAGRTRAIAIRTSIDLREDRDTLAQKIHEAEQAGLSLILW